MKTFQDFDLMTIPMLEGIITDISGNKPKNKTPKAQLVQLAYDIQQPVGGEEPEAPTETLAEVVAESADDLLGDTPEARQAADEVEAEVIAANTEAVISKAPSSADDLAVGGDELPTQTLSEMTVEANKPVPLPPRIEVAVSKADADPRKIKRALAHIAGLRVDQGIEAIRVTKGAKIMTTTVKQPLHVIVRTVETFARSK